MTDERTRRARGADLGLNSRPRRATRLLIALGSILAQPLAAFGMDLDKTVNFDIPAQELGAALLQFSRQTRIQVIVSGDIRGERTQGVSGRLAIKQALSELLQPAGLQVEVASDDSITVTRAIDPRSQSSRAEHGNTFIRIAQADPAADSATSGTAADPASAQARGPQAVEEIIVTAQKRSERLFEVPVPVTVLAADDLVRNDQVRLQDYFTHVPGVNFTSGNRGEPFVAIRGITTSPFTNPTVGIMVDDIPYGPTSLRGGGLITPDIDPSDLERVEVLRGPQGTLYGVSSIGGLIKYVTVDPSTQRLSGHIQTGMSSVENGDDIGYSARGAVNVPLGDTFAVRASAFTRSNPGYVDNPAAGIEGVNEGEASGGRLAALWQPSEVFSMKLGALYQTSDVDGSPLIFRTPGLGDLQQSYLSGSGWLEREFQAYSATVNATLGAIELVSLTGYNINELADSVDTSRFFGGIANARFGVQGAPITDDYRTEKFSQEIRLTALTGERFEWLFGGFFTDERSSNVQEVLAVDPATGTTRGAVGYLRYPTTYQEYAGFVDLTVSFSDRFDVQVGARQSHNEQTYADTGPLFGGGVPTPELRIEDDPFTYLLTPRFRVSQDLMIYARFASGYRAGGINSTAISSDVPPGFDADTTENFEVGAKAALWSGRLTFDGSIYYIDWQDIQLNYLNLEGVGFQANGGRARSQGIELALQARPFGRTSIALTGSWSEAELAEDFGPDSAVRGNDGDRLPFSSRFSGALTIEQGFALSTDTTLSVGGTLSYVGDRVGLFQAGLVRQGYPSYSQLDLHGTLDIGSWTASLFANNVTDKRGLLGGGLGNIDPNSFFISQPRTLGLSLTKAF